MPCPATGFRYRTGFAACLYGCRCRVLNRPLRALGHAVVAHHAGHTDAIVGKNVFASALLRFAVSRMLAPLPDRGFIAPERKRQYLALVIEAGETLDRNETVDFLEFGA